MSENPCGTAISAGDEAPSLKPGMETDGPAKMIECQSFQQESPLCSTSYGTNSIRNPSLCCACQAWNNAAQLFPCGPLAAVEAFQTSQDNGESEDTVYSDYQELNNLKSREICMICNQIIISLKDLNASGFPRPGESIVPSPRIRIRSAHLVQTGLQEPSSRGIIDWGPKYLSSLYHHKYSVHTAVVVEILYPQPLKTSILDEASEKSDRHASSRKETIIIEFAISYRHNWYGIIAVTPWDRSYFSINMVKQWISHSKPKARADGIHGKRRQHLDSRPCPHGFRIIDTFQNRIIQVNQARERYVALSYVWATSSAAKRQFQLTRKTCEEASHKNALLNFEVPPIIADTIRLCRDLGERYLWVDRLCVVQDDPASKYSQISAMDRIYQEAAFTIISLTDGTICDGIPGVAGRPRTQLNRGLMIGRQGHVYNDIKKLIKDSRWNSRGWTFQEQLLSQRQLYIAENHIFFVSRGELQAEEPLGSSYYPSRPSHRLGYIFLNESQDTTPQQEYLRIVEEYKTRTLTFKSDILNAFSGISSRLEETLGTKILFGHPRSFLGLSLLWGHAKSMREQDKSLRLPSWSWAGWDGPISYNAFTLFTMSSPYNGSYLNLIKLHCCGTDGKVTCNQASEYRPFWSYDSFTSEQDIKLRFKSDLHCFMWSNYGQPGDEAVKSWENCGHTPWDTHRNRRLSDLELARASKYPGCLIFNTTIATFRIRAPPTDDPSTLSTKMARLDAMMTVDIIDEEGKTVGQTAKISLQWMQKNEVLDGQQHFVVINGGVYDPLQYRQMHHKREASDMRDVPLVQEEIFKLCVMLVKSHGDGTYSRVTVGLISLLAWARAAAKWQLVILI